MRAAEKGGRCRQRQEESSVGGQARNHRPSRQEEPSTARPRTISPGQQSHITANWTGTFQPNRSSDQRALEAPHIGADLHPGCLPRVAGAPSLLSHQARQQWGLPGPRGFSRPLSGDPEFFPLQFLGQLGGAEGWPHLWEGLKNPASGPGFW